MVNSALNRRESLVLTAIEIINELGIQGLSTREVAKRQNMSNAAIFNHFRSKSELVAAVLDHYFQYDSAIIQSSDLRELRAKEAILYYFDSFVTYYENYPAITAIIPTYDVFRCETDFTEKVKGVLYGRREFLKRKLEEAQSLRQIRRDIDSTYIADIILGSWKEICLNWRMEGYDFPLKNQVMRTLEIILDSLSSVNK